MTLKQWLGEADLTDYQFALQRIGVKKSSHLQDVTSANLKDAGMSAPEIRRFFHNFTSQDAEKVKVNVVLPSTTFGQSSLSLSE